MSAPTDSVNSPSRSMASKSASSGKEKLIGEEEEVLQAVILADSFNKRFRPLTTRKPRCLLPICNAPLLDWTFESLALAGVQEVFVICRSHAELVKNAIKESKWSKPGSGMKIVPIMTAKETFSPGDAMRDIYTRGLVTSDFVLVMGDLVSNIRIDEVVRVHKERRRTNKDAIMTMVVKESGGRHRTRARGESSIFVLDPETSECLHYEQEMGYPRKKLINIPREVLAAHPEVEIRNDLIDCSIDVCSVEVPSLFQDNFDYLDIRRDFKRVMLPVYRIHAVTNQLGVVFFPFRRKDILSRWTFPLVPDDNHPGGHIYDHTRGNRYIAKDNTVVLARTCNIGTNTLIGSSTKVSENVTIIASVIGQNCTIGPGSTISNSYIFENAVVGANCAIERSIIGADRRAGPNATLAPFERLSAKRGPVDIEADADDDDSDIEEVEANQNSIDKKSLGKDSNAIVWPRGPPDEEDEDEESPENYKNQRFMRLGDNTADLDFSDAASTSSDEETTSDDDDDVPEHASVSGLSDASFDTGVMQDAEFHAEVKQSLERAFAEGHSIDNASVELKTLRMASNVPLTRVKEAVIAAIVEKIQLVDGDAAAQRKEIGTVIGRWGELINRIGGVDPVETVSILQAHCASSTRMPLFGQILAALYQEDIVEEDNIRSWHALPASKGGDEDEDNDDEKLAAVAENIKRCWMIGTHMINQFNAQDSESEEETETESEADEDKEEKKKAKPASAAAAGPTKPVDSSGEDDDSDSETDGSSGSTEGADGGVSGDQSDDGLSVSGDSSANPSTNASEDESEDLSD
ncbi:unnamed protein product [Cyclocybe aegerita]|uniref:Translation initiation factor eIF2B subunit epsilon n=1 Tax=Cyclocybe aegerita TaxID=1973307 RepID=A0A8S0WUT4_CYCAE|nr:unnamed protein product [Cyclocybe aegerita]